MSISIFPTSTQIPGVDISISREVEWATITQTAISGKEARTGLRPFPRRTYGLKFNFLRSGSLFNELQTLEGFFNSRRDYDTFLWTDPDDNSVTGQFIGVGDGVTQNFNLVRPFGGFVENVYAPQINTVQVFKADWQGTNLQTPYPRTNFMVESQMFSSAYSANFVAINSTNNVAPDGTLTGTLVTNNSTAPAYGQGYAEWPASVSSGVTYTLSAFYKANSTSARFFNVIVLNNAQTAGARFFFELSSIQTAYVFSTMESAADQFVAASVTPMQNGWYRVQGTFTAGFSTIGTSTSIGALTYWGIAGSSNSDGPASTTASFYIWGLQFEIATAATPYIASSSGTGFPIYTSVTDYSINPWGSTSPGLVELSIPPLVGASITANFSYYQPVRFTDQNMTFSRFVNQIYENKKVAFKTILP